MSKNNVDQAILATIGEVQELLNKSFNKLQKDENSNLPEADENQPQEGMPPEAPAAPEQAEAQSEGQEEAPAPEQEAPAQEQAEAPAEGAEGQDLDVEEIAKELESMHDEDLQSLVQLLQQELASRQAPAAAPEAPMAPQAPANDSLKSDLEKVSKEVMEMKKSIEALKSENSSLKKSLKAPASKPALFNKNTKVEVLEKTAKPVEFLSKSEVITHLENLRKSGNRSVDTDMIWSANRASTPEDIKAVYDSAKLKGITLPTK